MSDFVDTASFMISWNGLGEFPDTEEDIKHVIQPTENLSLNIEEQKEVSFEFEPSTLTCLYYS